MATDYKPISHYTSADIVTTQEVFANRPQVWPELRKSFGQGILTFDLISVLKGNEKVVSSESMDVHEQREPFRTMKVATISGGASAGVYADITLDADDLDTYENYYPREGQAFWFGTAKALGMGYIKTITVTPGTPDTVTLRIYPFNASLQLNSYITTGTVLPLAPATNHGQGTAATTPTHVSYQKFTYYTEVLKDALGYENAEFAREKYVEYEGLGLYNSEITRMDMNLDAAMEAKILFGQQNTNTSNIVGTSLATNKSVVVPTTVGLWDWIGSRGSAITFNNSTDFTIEHFYQIAEYAETVGLPASTWLFDAGGTLLRRVEKSCKAYITNSAGSLNEMFTPEADGGKKDLTVGFKHITIGGQTIVLKPNYIMNNPYLFGISALGIKDAAFLYQLGTVRDGKTGEMIPNIGLMYRGLGQYNDRKRAIAPFIGMGGPKGAIGGPVLLEGDVTKVHALVDFGLVALEMWRAMKVYNTDI